MADDDGGFLGAVTRGWTGPSLVGAGLSLLPLLASLWPRKQEYVPLQPWQQAGINRSQELSMQAPPQYTEQQFARRARQAAMEGAGAAGARGFMAPGGGLWGRPQIMSADKALEEQMKMERENLSLQQGGRAQNQAAANSLIGAGLQMRPRDNTFLDLALRGGQGFGAMIPQPMRQVTRQPAEEWWRRSATMIPEDVQGF